MTNRIPDVVVWPQNHDQVVAIVNAAQKHSITHPHFDSNIISLTFTLTPTFALS